LSNLKKLEKMVGIFTVDLILAGEVEKALVQFREGTKVKATAGIFAKRRGILTSDPENSTVIKGRELYRCIILFQVYFKKGNKKYT